MKNPSNLIQEKIKELYRQEVKARQQFTNDTNASSKIYSKDFLDDLAEQRNWSFGCANLMEFIPHSESQNRKILDYGCGAGLDMGILLKKHQPKFLYGVDISPEMLKIAREKLRLAGHENFELKSELDLSHESGYDLAYSNAVIHLNPDKLKILKQIHRSLNQDGVFYLADFATKYPVPESWKEEYLESQGLFLFGGLIPQHEYLELLAQAGFEEVDLLQVRLFDPSVEIQNMFKDSEQTNKSSLLQGLDQQEFRILILRCQKKLGSEQLAYQCPNCQRISPNRNPFYRNLNFQVHRRISENLKEKLCQVEQCEQCQTEQFPAPFQAHDMQKKRMAFCFPYSMRIDIDRIESEILSKFRDKAPTGYTLSPVFDFQELSRFFDFGE